MTPLPSVCVQNKNHCLNLGYKNYVFDVVRTLVERKKDRFCPEKLAYHGRERTLLLQVFSEIVNYLKH